MFSRSIVALFCEDIREEIGGKTTLVGVLPDNVNVPARPSGIPENLTSAMPKLCILIKFHFDPADRFSTTKHVITFPNGEEKKIKGASEETVTRARKQAIDRGAPFAGLIIKIVMAPFPATIGRCKVETIIGPKKYLSGFLNF